jgi:hypothetical protein
MQNIISIEDEPCITMCIDRSFMKKMVENASDLKVKYELPI